jgi:hypothetical protein
MELLRLYLTGAGIALLFGIAIAVILRSGLSALLSSLFTEASVRRFWSRIIYTMILLASVSGAMSVTYPDEAKTDRLILIWSFMNQMEGMGFRLLWTLLILFSVLLFSYAFKRKDA